LTIISENQIHIEQDQNSRFVLMVFDVWPLIKFIVDAGIYELINRKTHIISIILNSNFTP